MSELLDMIKTRRSIRKYKSDMVPKEIIDKIVEQELTQPQEWDSSHRSFLQLRTKK